MHMGLALTSNFALASVAFLIAPTPTPRLIICARQGYAASAPFPSRGPGLAQGVEEVWRPYSAHLYDGGYQT